MTEALHVVLALLLVAPAFEERVVVERIVVEARVIGPDGAPLEGLAADDFEVRVDGKAAKVDAADWIPEVPSAGFRESPLPPGTPEPRGRLVVLFFQRHLEPDRIIGLMKVVPRSDEVLDTLRPGDRVAAFTFDSRLHLLTDFTDDLEGFRMLLRATVVHVRPHGTPRPARSPSLAPFLDAGDMARAAWTESALLVVARALERIPGDKTLIFFCWGLGKPTGSGVLTHGDFEPAIESFGRAHTTVYAIDYVEADGHTLQGHLFDLARWTGGFYARTYPLLHGKLTRVARAMEGHYSLAVVPPAEAPDARRDIEIRLTRAKGTVWTRPYYDPSNTTTATADR